MSESETSVLVRRRFRVAIDIEVTVTDITDEAVDAALREFSNYEDIRKDPFYREAAERDRRLALNASSKQYALA